MTARRSIIIVGGGASGVILAAHLLKSPDPNLRVTVIEKGQALGRGRAYSTSVPDHLLNVRATGMSALADDPDHFWRWLQANAYGEAGSGQFAARSAYGSYLGEIMERLLDREQGQGRLHVVHDECVSVLPAASGVEARLASGASIVGRRAVLAVGHDENPAPAFDFATMVDGPDHEALDPDARVLILGTGLSMVDAWLSLRHRGHRGEIVALSRRGLLPSPHRQGKPVKLDSADIPLGTDLSYFISWFRDLVRLAESLGGNWRDVIDGLRPFNQRIWQSWPASAKRRFLTHTKAWWDVHRHRMAPQIYQRVSSAVNSGELVLLAGRLGHVRQTAAGFEVHMQATAHQKPIVLDVARIYDCTGIVKDVSIGSIGVIRSLIAKGFARPDPLRTGLDVTTQYEIIGADGLASANLYAVGPLTRGTFFEIDAIPDIRVQCADLASRLIA